MPKKKPRRPKKRHGGWSPPWTPAEDALLRQMIRDHPYAEIAEAIGRPPKGCQARAKALGLRHVPVKIYHPPALGEGARRCHDCGAPTTDFRCPRCWAKIRAENDWTMEDELE